MSSLPSSVLQHVVDVHCHPTDAPSITPESMDRLSITICAMSTMQSDQQIVYQLATSYPQKVVPCFGYHPWFSYLIATTTDLSKEAHYRHVLTVVSDDAEHEAAFQRLLSALPDPRPLADVINELRSNLKVFPNSMLGEVGLDRVFRVPFKNCTTSRRLSPFTIPLDHQLTILEAQLDVAVELGRNVSMHSVKSQLATTVLLSKMSRKHGDRWYKISIDMHSCGLSPETWRNIETKHSNIFLSLSSVINGRHPNFKSLVQTCADDRLLVESDYHDIDMCTAQTVDILKIVAEVKGWHVETEWQEDLDKERGAVRKLEDNWLSFVKGNHAVPKW